MTPSRPRPLVAPPDPPSRLSREALPAYRHVPGLTPHPVTHPAGHSYGHRLAAPAPACLELPDRWRDCTDYLYGADLFNRAYLWEAHEAWEAVWKGAGEETPPGQFVQGLIQTAASLLRRHLGTAAGSLSLWRKACRRFDAIVACSERKGASASYMGIDLVEWRARVERYLQAKEGACSFPFIRLSP